MLKKLFSRKKSARRVLIVEDDALLSRAMAESLKAEKVEVLVVGNGSNVLAEAIRFSPKVILLDLILPGIDGFMVLKQLKEEIKTKNIPVAVVSNLDQISDVKSAKTLGADQYFLKANTKINIIIQYVKDKLK
ncbi:MAG: response regulator [Patescibacteria group bacterium]|jgi:DNA-binding response OmpR family regulator